MIAGIQHVTWRTGWRGQWRQRRQGGVTGIARWKPADHRTFPDTAESVTNQITLRAITRCGSLLQRRSECEETIGALMKLEYRSASERVNYTLDYYRLWADVPKALGQIPYANGADLSVSWFLTERLVLRGVTGMAWGGRVRS